MDRMTETEQAILQALTELQEAAAGKDGSRLGPLFERIDRLAAQLPAGTNPELAHFLQRKSYEKARAKLEGQKAARGACGR